MSNTANDENYIKALKRHAKDSNGDIIFGTFINQLPRWYCAYTPNTWEDGVPVTKYFGRCDEHVAPEFNAGDRFVAMRFIGNASGGPVYHFKQGSFWFELVDPCDEVLDLIEEDDDENE